MDRTQRNPDYTLVKPWMQLPYNCVIPTHVAAEWARTKDGFAQFYGMCGGVRGIIGGYIESPISDSLFGGACSDTHHTTDIEVWERSNTERYCTKRKSTTQTEK